MNSTQTHWIRCIRKQTSRIILGIFATSVYYIPQVVFGADGSAPGGGRAGATSLCSSIVDLKSAIGCAIGLLTLVVPLLIGFALIAFLYGLLKYVSQGDNTEERSKARDFIIFGIIGLFVMVSVYGLVSILLNTFSGTGGGGGGGGNSPQQIDGIPVERYNPNAGSGGGGGSVPSTPSPTQPTTPSVFPSDPCNGLFNCGQGNR